jgi:proteic killer suppression protein
MIEFKSKNLKDFWESNGRKSKGFSAFADVLMRKLRMIDAAMVVEDLRVPPGNRLEALQGDRSGQYSIRVNEQFRLCFVWSECGAIELEIVDYHK